MNSKKIDIFAIIENFKLILSMKKLLRSIVAAGLLLGTTIAVNAQNSFQFSLGDETWTYNVDTLFHAKVGPGTTQTYLELTGSSRLQVFYLTIDKRTPGVSIRSVCATDKVAGTEKTSTMATRKSKDGLIYFAGTNGDFYSTSGSATNGTSKVGSPSTSCFADREIYKTSNSNYQFSIDVDGVARIGRLNYYSGTATLGEKVTIFKGVNVASPANGITIYTPKYWGSTNQTDKAGSCAEVTAKLVEGDNFYAGTKFRLEVTSTATSDGDTPIPADGFVIHGRGTSTTGCNTGSLDFVNSLNVGDIIEFDNVVLYGPTSASQTERIVPTQVVSGNPKNLSGGIILDSEAERGDAIDKHPRTGIGISQTGDSIIMMVIDGRSQISAGVRTSQLAGIMRYAGAYEAVNLDGGGSSTLYTQALGVRNVGSDGNERAVGNAIFAVMEAPEDNEIAEIRFKDWAMTFPKYGIYTPTIYGYNKYGIMVNSNVQGFTLSCPAELGEITNEGDTFLGNGDGVHALTATYNGLTASIPVTIQSASSAEFKYTDVLLDNYREWPAEVRALVRGEYMPLASNALSWSSADASIAQVDAESGVVKGVSDGTTTITGNVGDFTGTMNLTVECPTDQLMPIEKTVNTESWTSGATVIGVKDCSVTAMENSGISIDYTVASGRSRSISLSRSDLKIWSLPDALKFTIDPGTAKITTLKIIAKANNGIAKEFIISSVPQNAQTEYEIPVTAFGNVNDIGIYPIWLSGINITLSGGTVGATNSIQFPKFDAVYNNAPSGIEDITVDKEMDGPAVYYNLQGMEISKPGSGLYIVKRGGKATKEVIK